MEEEHYQKELFEFDKPKRSFPRLTGILPKSDFDGKIAISLTLEKLIFIAIGIIMLMVIVFALGVEKGKALIGSQQTDKAISDSMVQTAPVKTGQLKVRDIQPLPQAPSVPEARTTITQPQAARQKIPSAAKPRTTLSQSKTTAPKDMRADNLSQTKPYTIAVATFRQKDYALQEVNKLKKDGFDSSLVQNDPYFLVCVGSYANKDTAQSALTRIKHKYRDAYLKLR